MSLIEVSSEKHFEELTQNKPTVVHFWASWCELTKDMDQFLLQLNKKYSNIQFVKIEAEKFSTIAEKFAISAVPTFVIFNNGKQVGKVEGADTPSLVKLITQLAPKKSEDLESKLKKLISMAPIVLFMKGTPDEPRCGFSAKIVAILKKYNCEFAHFNILADEEVRQGLKKFSNWPTYPQLYVNGQLIGGLDIVKELDENGELADTLKVEPLEKKLERLINNSEIMLFMKGTPDEPRCGFSAKIVQLLRDSGITFGSFDVLSDESVRSGLKTYSNWPTYPQLYAHGKLIGGLDVVTELKEEGELENALKKA